MIDLNCSLVALASPLRSRLVSVALAGALPVLVLVEVSAHAAPRNGNGSGASSTFTSQPAPATGAVQLKVRRLSDSVELVIEGAGMAPELRQSSGANGWQGQLTTAAPTGLRVGPQRLSMPELGFQSITLDGSGSNYQINVAPLAGVPLGRAVVSGDGENLIISFPATAQVSLPVARFNTRQPGFIPQPSYAPPLQPRAVAPPLGDMAVGSMTLRNPGFLNLNGPPVTMTLKNAPAKDVLMALAQIGGYGFAYVAEPVAASVGAAGAAPTDAGATRISLAFRGESYGRAFNTALLAAGLQGKREGNIILAGPKVLSKSFGSQLSKVYRLNQVGPNAAADYLANLGATVTKTNTITTSVTQGGDQNQPSGAPNSATTQSSSITNVEAYGATTGPLLGLRATTDSRLGTITLVGDPAVVSVAEQYLKQLDLRQRQVALNVRILDVNLDNVSEIDNSFAFRWGNNFVVNNSGELLGAFGRDLPPDASAFRRDVPRSIEFEDGIFTAEGGSGGLGLSAAGASSASSLVIEAQRGRSLDSNALREVSRRTGAQLIPSFDAATGRTRYTVVPLEGTSSDGLTKTIQRLLGRQATVSRSESSAGAELDVAGIARNPGNKYQSDTFFDFVRAQIISGSTKLLASPTLILQENSSLLREGSEAAAGSTAGAQAASQGITNIGLDSAIGRRRANEGVVRVGTNVVTGYETETPSQGGNVVCTPELSTAGLVLGARVEKIDDNGFVTFVLSPSVSAVTDQENAPLGCGSNLNILSIRSLDTGALRVRDGQTLIMTGVISDFDRTEVSKWPILGDMPLVGQFFRASSGRKEKRELVIMVTPRIVNDEQGGAYGYGYQPGTSAGREFFGAANSSGGMN